MLNLIYNEVYKIFAGKKIYVFMLIILGFTLLPGFESAVGAVDFPLNGQNLPLYMMPTIVNVLLPIFVIVMMAAMVTEEYASGTLKLPLLHPVTRTKLMTAKLLALIIPVTALLFFSMSIAYIIGTLLFGWGGEFIYNDFSYPSVTGILLTVGTYLSSIIPLVAFGAFIMLICLLVSSAGVAVGISIGLLILFTFLGQIAEFLQPFFVVTYLERFAKSIFFGTNVVEILIGVIVMTSYALLSHGLVTYLFNKRDLIH